MPPDETFRAFLLGMSEDEVSSRIEEGILDGSIDPDGLLLVEEELIDDYVFGRLSTDETQHFEARFLANEKRRSKIKFSRSIHEHALNQARRASTLRLWPFPRIASAAPAPATRRPMSLGFPAVGWRFALIAALSCFGGATAWLGLRTTRLSHELAESARAGNERERLLASLMERERRDREEPVNAEHLAPTVRSAGQPTLSATTRALQPESEIRLKPGVTRGVERLHILYLTPQSTVARITLELPFKPQGAFREELFRSSGERIWSQEFFSADSVATHGMTTIDLPAKLLSSGDYQLKLKESSTGETSSAGTSYIFRVRAE